MSSDTETGAFWRFVGTSVRGASHVRQNLPNQDSLASNSAGGESQLPCLAALSDGHGSARCFRSEVGSQLAVDVFIEALNEFLAGNYGEDLSLIKRTAETRLPQQIARLWQERVEQDLAHNPVSEAQWQSLQDSLGVEQVERIKESPLLIYGATLLGVAITAQFILYLQLGDGEMLALPPNGEPYSPLPKDERLIANETTSLCQPEAWKEFRFHFQVMTQHPACLLLLCTDGYANAFRDATGFEQVSTDLLEILREEGAEYISEHLPDWLNQASEEGSGDDVTVALLWNPLLIQDMPKEKL